MDDQILDVPPTLKQKLYFAGFWIRFAAALIDGIIVTGVNAMLASSFFDDYSVINPPLEAHVLFVILATTYFSAMESSAAQATLGKMAMGIRVGTIGGGEIPFATAIGRCVAKGLSALIFFTGFLMAAWTPKNQALHDRLARTYVYYA